MKTNMSFALWIFFSINIIASLSFSLVPTACNGMSTGLQKVCVVVMDVCTGVRNLIPPVAVLMIMGSGVVYAGGQFTGAETRARANVWSTNMLVGAIMGLIIATVGPAIINMLWQGSTGTGAVSITC